MSGDERNLSWVTLVGLLHVGGWEALVFGEMSGITMYEK